MRKTEESYTISMIASLMLRNYITISNNSTNKTRHIRDTSTRLLPIRKENSSRETKSKLMDSKE
jgi:hypothetical protein